MHIEDQALQVKRIDSSSSTTYTTGVSLSVFALFEVDCTLRTMFPPVQQATHGNDL
jgi:hypothetical protein